MKLLSLTCNQCGAPLEVPSKANYVTCQFCEARLQIHQTGSAAYTEVLEALEQKTNKIADDVSTLKLQNSLYEVDRDWERQKQTYMVKGKDGHMSIPSKAGSVVTAVLGTVFGLFWMAVAGSNGAGGMAFFGIIIIAVALMASMLGFQKADAYERSKRRYKQRRSDLISQMNE